jgi:hypothetical protein
MEIATGQRDEEYDEGPGRFKLGHYRLPYR